MTAEASSPPPLTRARLTVDLGALEANYRTLAARAPSSETGAVVKCDAYGIGVAEAAPVLRDAGCKTFFVATLEEGETLRGIFGDGDPAPVIYIFNGCPPGEEARCLAARLRPVLNSRARIDRWRALSAEGPSAPAALHVDTAMSRLGLRLDEFEAFFAEQGGTNGLQLSLIMSHLANGADRASATNEAQAARFAAVRSLAPSVPGSLANS
ncbi:MAG: alanine racemase, partial [Pseudomonadota bacterium]